MQSLVEKKAKMTTENPFYNMNGLLSMFTQLPKASDSIAKQQVFTYLQNAWSECSNSKQKREAFFAVFFSVGDVQNREHNIFRKRGIKDVDEGGHSKRKIFAYMLEWLITNHPVQFYKFMPILGEYYNLDVFRMYHLTTDRKTGTVTEVIRLPLDVDVVTSHIASILKDARTTDNDKALWARWLPHVPCTKRIRKYTMTDKNIKAFQKNGHDVKLGDVVAVKRDKQVETNSKDAWVSRFIQLLSTKMGWQAIKYPNNWEFRGYKSFRSKFQEGSEAAMFSTKKIEQLDETQLLEWFDKLPNGARHRVAHRLVYKDKNGKYVSKGKWFNKFGIDMASIYIKWLELKTEAQTKVRTLTEDQRKELNPVELRQLEKAAKVNTGADSLLDVIVDVFSATSPQEADAKIQSIMDKISIEVPVRLVVDISGSMASRSAEHKGRRFTAAAMSRLVTTLFLLKSPEEELSDAFIRFDNIAEFICSGTKAAAAGANRFMSTNSNVVGKLVDRTQPFSWNLTNVSQYVISRGGTDLSSIAIGLGEWVNAEPALMSQRIEAINKYPVWLMISDGDINNMPNANASIQKFQMDMKQYFGWDGILVLWDIKDEAASRDSALTGLTNFVHLSGMNPSILNQVFKNLHDLDIVDSYAPLKAIHSSNRYSPVIELVG